MRSEKPMERDYCPGFPFYIPSFCILPSCHTSIPLLSHDFTSSYSSTPLVFSTPPFSPTSKPFYSSSLSPSLQLHCSSVLPSLPFTFFFSYYYLFLILFLLLLLQLILSALLSNPLTVLWQILESVRSNIDISEIIGSNTYDFERVSQSAAWVKAINGDEEHMLVWLSRCISSSCTCVYLTVVSFWLSFFPPTLIYGIRS